MFSTPWLVAFRCRFQMMSDWFHLLQSKKSIRTIHSGRAGGTVPWRNQITGDEIAGATNRRGLVFF
jgi:hypothetical protein